MKHKRKKLLLINLILKINYLILNLIIINYY
jgi:hypothetical protein